MGIIRQEPITTATTTFICDRCGQTSISVVEVASDWRTGPPIGEEGKLPDRWQSIDIGLHGVAALGLVFCQRACMSTWLGGFVKRLYEPEAAEEAPTRVRRSSGRARGKVDEPAPSVDPAVKSDG